MIFSLVPYVGATPINFGMSTVEVERVLGPAALVRSNWLGERDEIRGGVSIRYPKDRDEVVEIAFVPGEVLIFEGVNLLEDPHLLNVLTQRDQPYESSGFLVFFAFGVTVTGFHDDDKAQRAITVFERGRWDHVRPRMKKYAPAE